MLGKLLKHDFKSLLRRIWPAFLILFASAGLCRLFWRLGEAYPAFNLVRGLGAYAVYSAAGRRLSVRLRRVHNALLPVHGERRGVSDAYPARYKGQADFLQGVLLRRLPAAHARRGPGRGRPSHSTSRRCSARCGPCSKPRLPMRDWALCGSCRCLHCAP